jgi:hypothetical protein
VVGSLRRQTRRGGLTGSRPRALLAIGCAAGAVAACGGSHGASSSGSSVSAPPIPTTTARTANCLVWNASNPSDRRRLVVGLRAFFSQRLDTGARERVPADDRAYAIIDHYCRLPFARAFLIYRLYGNAAGFSAP